MKKPKSLKDIKIGMIIKWSPSYSKGFEIGVVTKLKHMHGSCSYAFAIKDIYDGVYGNKYDGNAFNENHLVDITILNEKEALAWLI